MNFEDRVLALFDNGRRSAVYVAGYQSARAQAASIAAEADRLIAEMAVENAELREALAAKEAELERVRAALEEEEHSHAKTIDDRDSYHDQADALAMAISELTGVDIGEHSSANNPWAEALVAIDEYKAALASPPVGHQPKASAGAGSDGTGAVLDTTLTAAAMKRVANELAAAAANMSDEEDDFELGLRVYPPGIVAEDDDGTPSKHPVLAVFDAEYPEEGIYPVYLSGEQQPSLASPAAEPVSKTEELLDELQSLYDTDGLYVEDEDGNREPVILLGDALAMVEHVMGKTQPAQATESAAEFQLTAAVKDVLAERARQVDAEGWTPEHDDQHSDGQMAVAAGCYALASGWPYSLLAEKGRVPSQWPWAVSFWKPTHPRRMLIKAGALILAELERIDRAERVKDQIGGGE